MEGKKIPPVEFKPKVVLDPSKIRERIPLAATGMIVYLGIVGFVMWRAPEISENVVKYTLNISSLMLVAFFILLMVDRRFDQPIQALHFLNRSHTHRP